VLADPSVQGRKRLKGNAWKGIVSPRCTPAVTASVWAVEALGIEGAWVFTPQVYQDDRGAFFEAFRGGEFAADLGYRLDVAQVNCSVSRRGVIRGRRCVWMRTAGRRFSSPRVSGTGSWR
jgi:hypothetical protein